MALLLAACGHSLMAATVPAQSGLQSDSGPLSPTAIVATPDGNTFYVAAETSRQVLVYDLPSQKVVRRVSVQHPPLGLALSKDATRLYVSCAAPRSSVCEVETGTGKTLATINVGHTAMSPVLSTDGRTLFVCNRFDDCVSVVDVNARKETARIPVRREPIAAALSPDGRSLLVANHLRTGRHDETGITAMVSVIDVATQRVADEIGLPRGSGMVRDIAISPDGRFAAVTHLVARYYLTPTEVDFGRINANALSFLDVERRRWLWLVYLDQAGRGAANPWAVAWTPDGQSVVVTHAGTHDLSVVDAPRLPQKPVRVRQRVPLPGNGTRSFAFAGNRIVVANYFSDDLTVLDLTASHLEGEVLALGPTVEPNSVRRGEMFFNDARLCRQSWQSCASCHDADGRMDAYNWDLLNDGRDNPKNAKSLLYAHRTPPAMALGVRSTAEVAVRAGLRHILFTEQPESTAQALDAYLQFLRPVPSPRLVNGRLSPAAERGRRLFMADELGCARCHPPPLYTDCRSHNVGTRGREDGPQDVFDTPSLVELWRTGPYLHDGSASTVRDIHSVQRSDGGHGNTPHLSDQERDDLVEFLLSL